MLRAFWTALVLGHRRRNALCEVNGKTDDVVDESFRAGVRLRRVVGGRLNVLPSTPSRLTPNTAFRLHVMRAGTCGFRIWQDQEVSRSLTTISYAGCLAFRMLHQHTACRVGGKIVRGQHSILFDQRVAGWMCRSGESHFLLALSLSKSRWTFIDTGFFDCSYITA